MADSVITEQLCARDRLRAREWEEGYTVKEYGPADAFGHARR